jgi:hypothetical protein
MSIDLAKIMTSPLVQTGEPGPFLRLVLAEAARYGMPPQVVATLDDIGAMLGFYLPLPAGQSGHLAGPLVNWRTDRHQPTHEGVSEVNNLAIKQRALIAFGGAPRDHRVGTAEIVCALGNGHKEWMPSEYYEVFCWASTDVLSTLMRRKPDAIRKENGWPDVSDEDVVKPSGRLNPTYVTIATEIRRASAGAIKGDPESPREFLRPLGVHFLMAHHRVLALAEKEGKTAAAAQIRATMAAIIAMFPGIDRIIVELEQLAEAASVADVPTAAE